MGLSVSGWVNSFICLEEARNPWAGEGAGLCEAPPGGSETKQTRRLFQNAELLIRAALGELGYQLATARLNCAECVHKLTFVHD